MKRWISVLAALCLVIYLLPTPLQAAAATDTPTVTVYFSVSHDEDFRDGVGTGEVMALKEISVPYFDLGLYGLQEFYFSSESYGDDGDGLPGSDLAAGTKEFAEGKITMLHLFIYATEVYYCGEDPDQAGKGYLANEGLLGTGVMQISGSRGSLFFEQFWDRDLNFNYYHNFNYPLASAGWGSTADQILLDDGDVVTMGHFTDWNFYNDPDSIFNYIKAGDEKVHIAATKGDQVELTIWRAGATENGDYNTGHEIVTSCPEVYINPIDEIETDISNWTPLGTADANGSFTVDTSDLEPGRYMVAVPGQLGSSKELNESICSTPGAILLDVEPKPGDINDNGKNEPSDAAMLYAVINSKFEATETQLSAADVNGDGKVNANDAAMLYAAVNGKLTLP